MADKIKNKIEVQSDTQIRYSIQEDGCSRIIFWTDDDRIYNMVADYIHNVLDAVNYRRLLVKVKMREE